MGNVLIKPMTIWVKFNLDIMKGLHQEDQIPSEMVLADHQGMFKSEGSLFCLSQRTIKVLMHWRSWDCQPSHSF